MGDKNNNVELKIDNQSAIKLIQNSEYYKRSKHIDFRFHFIQENVKKRTIIINYIKLEQLADILTKNMSKKVFNRL